MPSYGQHSPPPLSKKVPQLCLLVVFISMLRHGTVVAAPSSNNGLESSDIIEQPSVPKVIQDNTTEITPMWNISSPVTTGTEGIPAGIGDACGRDKPHNLWACHSYFKYVVCGGPVLIMLIVLLVAVIVYSKRRADRVPRMNKVDASPIHHVFADDHDHLSQDNTRYTEKPQHTPCEDYMVPCSTLRKGTAVCDPNYANMKDTSLNIGHAVLESQHSCPLKRPINKNSVYNDKPSRDEELGGEDDDMYVSPQLATEQNGATTEGIDEESMDYMNVLSPLGSKSVHDICSAQDGTGSSFEKSAYDFNSRSAQAIRSHSYTDNSSGTNNADDMPIATDDDIYVNTSIGPTPRNSGRQGSGTSSTLFQTPIKPEYNDTAGRKRSRDNHDCSNFECNQKPLISNINSIYDDVMSDEAATDDTMYANVEYPPSNSDHGNSEGSDCEIYDDTCTVADNRDTCRTPSDDEVYDGIDMKGELLDSPPVYVDMSRGSSHSMSQWENEPEYLVLVNP